MHSTLPGPETALHDAQGTEQVPYPSLATQKRPTVDSERVATQPRPYSEGTDAKVD